MLQRGEMSSAAFVGASALQEHQQKQQNNSGTLTFGCRCPLEPGNADSGQTNQKNFMTNPVVRKDIQIDRVSSAAICEEIGDRLRIDLTGKPDRLPRHMRMLVEQMAQNDSDPAVRSAKRNRI
jgi:hypothetical protein